MKYICFTNVNVCPTTGFFFGARPVEHALSNTFNAARLGGFALLPGRVFRRLELAFQVARERRQLLALDAAALKDIGLSRADADGEAARKFWDLPPGR